MPKSADIGTDVLNGGRRDGERPIRRLTHRLAHEPTFAYIGTDLLDKDYIGTDVNRHRLTSVPVL